MDLILSAGIVCCALSLYSAWLDEFEPMLGFALAAGLLSMCL